MHDKSITATDPVTDAAKALGVSNVEQVFFMAAIEAGFTDAYGVAAHRYNQWWQDGYHALPPYIKTFCTKTLNKLSVSEYMGKVVIH